MKVNMFITSNVIKDKEGNVLVQACNRMVAIKDGKKIASKTIYRTGANSSLATLTAYIYGLKSLKGKYEVEVHTDIQYLVYTTSEVKKWANNKFINNYGKPCKNKDKLKELVKVMDNAKIITPVRHSSGDKYMSACKEVLKQRLLKKVA